MKGPMKFSAMRAKSKPSDPAEPDEDDMPMAAKGGQAKKPMGNRAAFGAQRKRGFRGAAANGPAADGRY